MFKCYQEDHLESSDIKFMETVTLSQSLLVMCTYVDYGNKKDDTTPSFKLLQQ